MFLAHTHAYIQAERAYRIERSNSRFLELTTRRLARQRRRPATDPAGGTDCAAGDSAAWNVRSA
jgi:hypothetical protein